MKTVSRPAIVSKVFAAAIIITGWIAPPMSAASVYPYQSCFEIASRMHQVPVDLLLAVASVESAMNADARSNKNAHGIMQIQWPGTARHLGVKRVSELYNPCLNIELGARYLRELIDGASGNVERALAAYNYGPGRIARSKSLPEGARGYASKVSAQQSRINRATGVELQKLTTTHQVSFASRTRAERFASSLNSRISGASFGATPADDGSFRVRMAIGQSGLSATDVTTLQILGWNNLGGQ